MLLSLLIFAAHFFSAPTAHIKADFSCTSTPCKYLPLVLAEPIVRVTDVTVLYPNQSTRSFILGSVTNFGTRMASNLRVTADLYTIDSVGNRDFLTSVRGTPVLTYLLPTQSTPFQIDPGSLSQPFYTATARIEAMLITDTTQISLTVAYTPLLNFYGAYGADIAIRNTYSVPVRQPYVTLWSTKQRCEIRFKQYDIELQPGAALTDTWIFCPGFLYTVDSSTIRVAAQATK